MPKPEEWRDIAEYEGLYQVSSLGRVRSLDRIIKYRTGQVHKVEGRVLKPILVVGYHRATLYKNAVYKFFRINRLVAAAFIPNPESLPEVDHINEIKTDNRVDNLQWLTGQANSERSLAKHYKFISPTGELVDVFNLHKFCRDNNLNRGNINALNSGVGHSIKGWKAANHKEQCA